VYARWATGYHDFKPDEDDDDDAQSCSWPTFEGGRFEYFSSLVRRRDVRDGIPLSRILSSVHHFQGGVMVVGLLGGQALRLTMTDQCIRRCKFVKMFD